jgi:cytochrome P450
MREEVLGLGDRPIGFDDVKELPYTQQVVNETLRLHAPIWFLMRRVIDPVSVGGLRLEPGTQVLFSPTALHRDPRVHPDPFRFDPDRWPGDEQLRANFMPFGMGTRKCIGDVFARTEMAVVAATIVRRWRLEVATTRPVREVFAASIRPAELPMRVRPW